jgi:hypothetical protein
MSRVGGEANERLGSCKSAHVLRGNMRALIYRSTLRERIVRIMAETQVNEAATELTQSLRETYQTVAEKAVAAQERNVKFAQSIVETSIEELRNQAETARGVLQALSQQSNKQIGPQTPSEVSQTLREAYQTVLQGSVAAQERSVKFAQSIVENGTEELRNQAATTQAIIQTLAQQSERQRQAIQRLARESVEAYINFMFAPFSFYQKGFEAVKETVEQASQQHDA